MKLKLASISILLMLTIWNGKLFGQNTGPAAPEAMSFEPIDATDMVNLLSGDFSYVLPLIHVPGPGGGFSMPLSYHGGIAMDQEASWVGLGWSINPGAINRTVNGHPDDWKDGELVTIVKGKTIIEESFEIEAGVGFANGAGNIGISYSWGANKGFGGSVGFGANGTGMSLTYENGQVSGGIGFGHKKMRAEIGLSNNGIGIALGHKDAMFSENGVRFNNIDRPGGKFRIGNSNSIGIDFSSNGGGVNVFGASGGFGSIDSFNGSDYKLSTSGFFIPFHIKFFYIGFGKRKRTYTFYKEIAKKVPGSLFLNESYKFDSEGIQDEDYLFDSYSLLSNTNSAVDLDNYSENVNYFTAFDNYMVNSQGINGAITPNVFQKGSIAGNGIIINKDLEGNSIEEQWFNTGTGQINSESYFSFLNSNDALSRIDKDGTPIFENHLNHRRGGAICIEYFTNNEIQNNTNLSSRNFIEVDCLKDKDRTDVKYFDKDGIGAYTITSSDGKSYHYSLPVYQYEEAFRKNEEAGESYVIKQKNRKYAYTWLLTAITGSDYIDVNGNGLIDDSDIGYWVKFDYGKWSDSFMWQFPYDLENADYNTYDKDEVYWGRRQIYYLNAIKTKTHGAYFVKSLREDGKGCMIDYTSEPVSSKVVIDGEHYDVKTTQTYKISTKVPSLALSKIIVLPNSVKVDYNRNHLIDAVISNAVTIKEEKKYTALDLYNDDLPNSISTIVYPDIEREDILDENDINETIVKNALQVIDLNYDYSLCENTPNSLSSNKGKLTLKSIHIKGKGGTNVLPPYLFNYNEYGQYNTEIKDAWGYYKNMPEAWSLNSIITPSGAEFEVKYEKDSYNQEIMRGESIKYQFKDLELKTRIVSGSELGIPYNPNIEYLFIDEAEIELTTSLPLNKIFNVGQFYALKLEEAITERGIGPFEDPFYALYPPERNCKLLSISNNILKFELNYQFTVPENIAPLGELWFLDDLFHSYVIGPNIHYKGSGGGLRVAELNLVNEDGEKYKTKYNYNIPGTETSSGVTIYAPVDDGNLHYDFIPFKSELPAPSVIYEYVTVEEYGKTDNSDLKTLYNFEVYKPIETTSNSFKLGEQFQFTDIEGTVDSEQRTSILKSNFATVGRLLGVSKYNSEGDLLSKSENYYKSLNDINYGLSQETFTSKKIHKHKHVINGWIEKNLSNTTSKITYPSVLDKVVTTEGGFTSQQINLEWDKNTGKVTKAKSINPNGEEFISEAIPAYVKYPAMGSKILNPNNKNMLSQETANYQYKVIDGVPKLLSAGIQTWKDDWMYRKPTMAGTYEDEPLSGIWRKHKNFVLTAQRNDEGLINNWINFNWLWNDGQAEANNWIKTNEITQYNEWSAPLSARDINGNYTSTRYDKSGLNVIANASNSIWKEMTFTGFEQADHIGTTWSFEGEVSLTGFNVTPLASSSLLPEDREGLNVVSGIDAHTGKQYLKCVGTNNINISNVIATSTLGKSFILSAWVHKTSAPSAKFNVEYSQGTHLGTIYGERSGADKIQFGDWVLMKFQFSLPSLRAIVEKIQIVTDNSTDIVYVDDFRIRPLEASMNSYVYDKHTDELIAILDNENIATKYFYDAAGRLEKVEKETPDGFKKVSENEYYYANEVDIPVPALSNFSLNPDYENALFGMLRVALNHSVNSRPHEYCISIDDSNFSNTSWRVYSDNISTQIPLGNHTVYFKVRNLLSEESNVVSASINNYFDFTVNGSNVYSGDNVECTLYTPHSVITEMLVFEIYKGLTYVKSISPYYTSGIEGASEERDFSFSSNGLGLGEYTLKIKDPLHPEFYRKRNFKIISRPQPPSCYSNYDPNSTDLYVSWNNFQCNEVEIFVNGEQVGTLTGANGKGSGTIKISPFILIFDGGGEDPIPHGLSYRDALPPSNSNNKVKVKCTGSSTFAESTIQILN